MRGAAIAIAAAGLLAGCSLFGSDSDKPAETAGNTASSEEIVRKNCSDENWKQQNLGLWYSVCRPPLRW